MALLVQPLLRAWERMAWWQSQGQEAGERLRLWQFGFGSTYSRRPAFPSGGSTLMT
jgi:hypothetical protein